MHKSIGTSAILLVAFTACSSGPATMPSSWGSGAEPAQVDSNSSTQTFTRTVVTFRKDGSQDVQTTMVTSEELRAEQQAREAIRNGERTPDTLVEGCTTNYITFFDGDDFNDGPGYNEICFYNPYGPGDSPDYAYLPNYIESCGCQFCLCPTYWHGSAIKSWQNGNQAAAMTENTEDCKSSVNLGWNQDACIDGCTYLPPNFTSLQNYVALAVGDTTICPGYPYN